MLQYLSLSKNLYYVNAYHIIGRVKNMQSKKLVIIISMLVIASVFPIVTTSVAFDGSTIYVDDDGGADYTNIQDAIDAADDGLNRNESRHMFCVINLGNAQLMNFQGLFNSISIPTDFGTRYFGIGKFQLDLAKQNDMDGALLKIGQFHRQSAYFQNITIRVTTFIGWYHPTTEVSKGELSGFALHVKINPLHS